jgi:PAS domain S-box-containing protein
MNYIDLVHPDDRVQVQEISELRRRGEPVPDVYETRILRKDGYVPNYAERMGLAISSR